MYYESYRPKKQNSNWTKRPHSAPKSLGKWLGKLLLLLLAAILLSGAVLYALPVSFFLVERGEEDYAVTDGLPTSAINVLLIGVDVMSQGQVRSDTMLVASVGYSGVKLTSILRDSWVDIPGYGKGKLNSAYARGGAELLVRTINQNFSLNINRYVCVDYVQLVDAINAMGGVEIDITQAEMEQINANIQSAGKVFAPLGYSKSHLDRYGERTHLDGLEALGYARIRKLDSDFMRASRQRTLLSAMLTQLRRKPWRIPTVLLTTLEKLDTNLNWLELASLGIKAFFGGAPRQLRLPVDGSYTDDGSAIRIDDFSANVQAFRRFVYEREP